MPELESADVPDSVAATASVAVAEPAAEPVRAVRPVETVPANSLEEVMQAIRTRWGERIDQDGGLWFRGHAVQSWSLLPSLTRNGVLDERDVQRMFESEALPHLDRIPGSDVAGELEWMFLQQHYRAPTRLLDWTANLLVGLYFAVEDHQEPQSVRLRDPDNTDFTDLPEDIEHWDILRADTTGCLWVLDPGKLNLASSAHALRNKSNLDPVQFWGRNANSDAGPYALYTTQRIMETRSQPSSVGPYAFYSRRANERMVVQSAAFTIFDLTSDALDQWGPEDGSHIQKIVISPEGKRAIRKSLQLMGINKLRLFPTLDSVGEHARDHARRLPDE